MRAKTRTDHATRAARHLGFRRPGRRDLRELDAWLVDQAAAHARAGVLLADACERLLRSRIVRPGVTVLERRVLDARQEAERRVYDALRSLLEPLRELLEGLLVVEPEVGGTRLAWLRERFRSNSPRAIQGMLDKHQWLVDAGVTGWMNPPTRPQALMGTGQNSRNGTGQSFRNPHGMRSARSDRRSNSSGSMSRRRRYLPYSAWAFDFPCAPATSTVPFGVLPQAATRGPPALP